MKHLLVSAAILTFLSVEIQAQAVVGQAAPSFSLSPLGGGSAVSLAGLQGKVVYVFFYGAGCSHCRANGPVTESQIHHQFRTNNSFRAVGIDTWNESSGTNTTFRSVTGITYPLLLNGRNVLNAYYGNFSSYDRSVVIGADGRLLYRGTGFVNTDVAAVKAVIEGELNRIVGIDDPDGEGPLTTRLLAPYPNPFNPTTTLRFELMGAEPVRLSVHDVLGREVGVLVQDVRSAGSHTVAWNASGLASGLYLIRMSTRTETFVRAVTLVR